MLFACTDNTDLSLQKVDEGIDMMYHLKKEKAKKLFEEAIAIDPDNSEAYYYLGNYYSDRRKYAKAIENFSKAIEINSRFGDAYYGRGEAKFYLNDRKGACADWKLAATLAKATPFDFIPNPRTNKKFSPIFTIFTAMAINIGTRAFCIPRNQPYKP